VLYEEEGGVPRAITMLDAARHEVAHDGPWWCPRSARAVLGRRRRQGQLRAFARRQRERLSLLTRARSGLYYRGGGRIVAASFEASGAEPVFGKPAALFTDDDDFGAGARIATMLRPRGGTRRRHAASVGQSCLRKRSRIAARSPSRRRPVPGGTG
jgi:hypothetical protein